MKILLIGGFFMLASGGLLAQDNFYDLSVVSASGELANLSDYKGKKVLIVVASPGALQAKTPARYLGKIQSEYPGISVLILPSDIGADSLSAADSSSAIESKAYPVLNNTRFGALIKAGKDKSSDRGAMLQWLTRANGNKHFEKDILSNEQYYVISESGVLYAVLEKEISDIFLKAVLVIIVKKNSKPETH